MGEEFAGRVFALRRGWPAPPGCGPASTWAASGKLGRQLKWASDQGARWCLIYGSAEDEAGTVTVRDMGSGEQDAVPVGELGGYLARWPDRAG